MKSISRNMLLVLVVFIVVSYLISPKRLPNGYSHEVNIAKPMAIVETDWCKKNLPNRSWRKYRISTCKNVLIGKSYVLLDAVETIFAFKTAEHAMQFRMVWL